MTDIEKIATAAGARHMMSNSTFQQCAAEVLAELHDCMSKLEAMIDEKAEEREVLPRRINQRRGPAIKFTGALIAKTEFEIRGGRDMRLEIWETVGGALIAVSITAEETRAEVAEPGGELAMRCAVMDAFDWHERARAMVKDQLKWKLVREVA